MDFGSFAFTPDGVAAVIAGAASAGAVAGVLVAALAAMVRGVQ